MKTLKIDQHRVGLEFIQNRDFPIAVYLNGDYIGVAKTRADAIKKAQKEINNEDQQREPSADSLREIMYGHECDY